MRFHYWRAAAVLGTGALMTVFVVDAANAADYFRHSHHSRRSHATAGVYQDDRVCPKYEPADYRPRLEGQPLCYAARPYGLSQHLYDYSLDAQKPDIDGY